MEGKTNEDTNDVKAADGYKEPAIGKKIEAKDDEIKSDVEVR